MRCALQLFLLTFKGDGNEGFLHNVAFQSLNITCNNSEQYLRNSIRLKIVICNSYRVNHILHVKFVILSRTLKICLY